ncbi:helix-turn-helix domain-containing protein [Pontibacter toksunensis]|uniref:Helix-turn-helix domain-containing protein n=1 Tax=Pontibacter toksunensis TaxID=1332631 RepID=A0ABW6C2N5_9BACT
MPEKTFGNVLQELRREQGLTQEELAFRSSLDRTYISLLERGLRVPTIDTLFKVSKSLGTKPEDLVARIEAGR